MLFLRTDLYAVLVTGLGCVNLTRVSRLRMARHYRRLTAHEERELTAASPRDLAAARWYGWVQLGGAAIAVFYFVVFFAPAILHMIRWIGIGLVRSPADSLGFWEILLSGCVALLPVLIPPVIYLRERRSHRPGRPR